MRSAPRPARPYGEEASRADRGASRSGPRTVRGILALAFLAAWALATPGTGRGSTDIGVSGPSYAASGISAPTAEKPQSKLWHRAGRWYGVLFDPGRDAFTVHRYDAATKRWLSTPAIVDARNGVRVDVLSLGDVVYVASAGVTQTNSGHAGRLVRLRWNATAAAYATDTAFRVPLTDGGVEALVIARDSRGQLWSTFTQSSRVYVSHSQGTNHASWIAPYVLPGAHLLTSDDISSVVAFSGRIGVMWSDQVDHVMYFATHLDTDPDSRWQVEVALRGPEYADDHINLKTDATGRVYAATKTSVDRSSEPLLHLLVRETTGTWRAHVFSEKGEDQTRPMILIDESNKRLHMFAAGPCCRGGTIYHKSTPLGAIAFAAGPGRPFLRLASDPYINNPTSTKQSIGNASDLLLLAGDYTTKRYVHGTLDVVTGTYGARIGP